MKVILPLFAVASVLASCGKHIEQPTVSRLDISKYAGEWHEVGRLPNRFEKNVVAAKATYIAQPNKTLAVRNDGLKSQGKRTTITGNATQPDSKQPGRLKIRFDPFPANLFSGDYMVLGLTEGHTKALIGTPKQDSLWFLSKDPADGKEDFAPFLKTAKDLGYDTSKIFWNPKRLTKVEKEAVQKKVDEKIKAEAKKPAPTAKPKAEVAKPKVVTPQPQQKKP